MISKRFRLTTAVLATLATLPHLTPSAHSQITLVKKSTIITLADGQAPADIFDESAAEIVAYDKSSKRLFIVNGANTSIDVIDIQDIENPTAVAAIDLTPYGGDVTSVSVDPRRKRHEIAVAVPANTSTDPGKVVFFDTDGNYINEVEVGALPDMLTYQSNGKKIYVANEGEPGAVDPEGSLSQVCVPKGAANATDLEVNTMDFASLNGMEMDLKASGVRLFPGIPSVAQDLEPEYIALSSKARKAYVSLQEANSIAVFDLKKKRLLEVFSLGTKDHSLPGNGLDASDRDDAINIANWPVHGLYMPDAIASFKARGKNYIATANEGDDRGEDVRIKDLTLDPTAFPDAASLQEDENIGRLQVSSIDGDIDMDGDYDTLHPYGSRSFSIWTTRGELVFDSGDDFERVTAEDYPYNFNSSNDDNDPESRSDAKGPEPETVEIGRVGKHLYAFVGLERVGGIMVYNITKPKASYLVEYINNRDFIADPQINEAGDLGPEGIEFIPGGYSPTRKPLLVVANEVSGTTTIYQIEKCGRRY